MSKYICVICKPGQLPELCEIDASLEGMQKAVGGYLELFYATESGLDFFCNEEGKLIDLPFNKFFFGDYIAGNILVASHNDEGETVSLSEAQAWEALLMLINNNIQ